MKKTYGIAISFFVLLSIAGSIFFFFQEKEEYERKTLSEAQEVISLQENSQKKEQALSIEKQKQLTQIGDIYKAQESLYQIQIKEILQKYNAALGEEDITNIVGALETSSSQEEIQKTIEATLSIKLLQSDVRKIFSTKESLGDEKALEQRRLTKFREKNTQDIDANVQKLIEMSLNESLQNYNAASIQNIPKIVQSISKDIFETNNILNEAIFNSFEKQQALLRKSLNGALGENTVLTETQKITLIEVLLTNIYDLEVLLPKEKKSSFVLPTLSSLPHTFFSQTYAEDAVMSPEQRAILLLKTQIQIDKLIQKNIDSEISYNAKKITRQQYNTDINNNLVALEELVLFQKSLQDDESVISLDDIQRLKLGSYVDDSALIQSLPVLAYVEEKKGNVIIYNLNGSVKLAEENMPLYAGYAIETLPNAQVGIVFSDESLLRLDPLSQVSITNPTSDNIRISVEKGSLWTRVLKPLLSGEIFTIDTGDVSLAVRGTSLSISKNNTGSQIDIVDSYYASNSGGVTLTEKRNQNEIILGKGKHIVIDASGSVATTSKTRSTLLSQNPHISQFITEDLTYLSLLLNDRSRGFYNNPFSQKNDGENFIKKIEGELVNTLPTATDNSYLIKNPELAGLVSNSGSIYHLIQKDRLTTQIKNSTNSPAQKSQKINAIRAVDLNRIQETLGNQRALESIFEYNIAQDLINRNSLSTSELQGIFTSFPTASLKIQADRLQRAKQQLVINSGSNLVSTDISLQREILGAAGAIPISLSWQNTHPEILSESGNVERIARNTNIILTATLSLGNLSTTKDFGLVIIPQKLSQADELEEAERKLTDFVNNIALNDFISQLPTHKYTQEIDFTQSGGIIPIITWSGERVSADGVIRNPSYNESPDSESLRSQVTATLQHPQNADIPQRQVAYNIDIQRLDECDNPETERKIGNVCYGLVAKADYANRGDIDLKKISDNSKLPNTQSANVVMDECEITDFLGNCGWREKNPINLIWTPKQIIANEYKYDITKIGDIDASKSWMSYDKSAGIVLDNVGDPDYLSYNLSSLNLGNDWAIEMSVRGEDLRRDPKSITLQPDFNGILSIQDQIYLRNTDRSFGLKDRNGKTFAYTGTILNGYQKIFITNERIFYNGLIIKDGNGNEKFAKIPNSAFSIIKGLKVGGNRYDLQQWNGIINYLKIYEKSK